MVSLTDNAKKHLDHYLHQVKVCLKNCSTADADDVEQGIKEHIESELQDSSEPVSYDALDAVLKKLGSPQQWVPEEEIPWWRKIILRLRKGPEDWRLAYISFGLLFLSTIFFIFNAVPLLSLIFILTSFCLSRAALSAGTMSGDFRAQRWLIYPSLIIVYVFLALGVLFWPAFPLAGIADGMEHFDIERFPWNARGKMAFWLIADVLIGAITALWWVILSFVHKKTPKILQAVFHPFAGHGKPSGTNWFMGLSILLMVLCLVAGILMIKNDGWFYYVEHIFR